MRMPKWVGILSWPLRAEFGWMLPRSESDQWRDEMERRYYSSSLSLDERDALRAQIELVDPQFFQSDHFR